MVVCDIWTRVGAVAADEIGIPCVILNVFPWEFCTEMGLIESPSFKTAVSCCGCICIFRTLIASLTFDFLRMYMKHNTAAADTYLAHNRRVIICTSFFGLEPAVSTAPNIVFTGPLFDPPTDLLPLLKQKDEKLSDWLDKALQDKQDVVYVSIGSEALWREWSVKAIFNGLKKLGVKVVWSLKDEFKIPEPENPNFFVSPWVP